MTKVMTRAEALQQRHSVRMYTDEPADTAIVACLRREVSACNAESGLDIQLITGLPDAFMGYPTHYGRFQGVHNAIALIGRPDARHGAADHNHDGTPAVDAHALLELTVGYYGERLALRIVQLGLATSWAVLDGATDGWWTLNPGERAIWFLAFGHAARSGGRHRSKPIGQLCRIPPGTMMPDWFRRGMEAAMLAPTSLSQQPFIFILNEDDTVSAEATEGLFTKVGLGCAKYHFEIGAAPQDVNWR